MSFVFVCGHYVKWRGVCLLSSVFCRLNVLSGTTDGRAFVSCLLSTAFVRIMRNDGKVQVSRFRRMTLPWRKKVE